MTSFAVVVIFGVTKFFEGAWAVLVLFPILIFLLIRLNQRYREEAEVLGETAAAAAAEARPLRRHVALVMVDRLDLATARAIQYAKSLNVDDIRAVHFAIDTARAQTLEDRWVRLGMSRLALELVDCPDRRVVRAALEMAEEAAADGQTEVSVLLPRRSYTLAWNRLLHDSVGERIAAAVSRLEHVNATIVPFDVEGELRDRRRGKKGLPVAAPTEGDEQEEVDRCASPGRRHRNHPDPGPPPPSTGPGGWPDLVAHRAAVGRRAHPGGAAHRRSGAAHRGFSRSPPDRRAGTGQPDRR